MISVVSTVILGVLYATCSWINNGLLVEILNPVIIVFSAFAFVTLFVGPVLWMMGKAVYVKLLRRRPVDPELKQRLYRLAGETMGRMGVNLKLRFGVSKMAAGYTWRIVGRTSIVLGEKLLQTGSDEEVIGVLGHEMAHVIKKHLRIISLATWAYFFAIIAMSAVLSGSRLAAVLNATIVLALLLAMIPLFWSLEYGADRAAAERLGAKNDSRGLGEAEDDKF